MNSELLTPEPTKFQCRHIFTDGRRCGSPAIRGPEGAEPFCYYHHNSRRPIHDAPTRKRRQSRFTLPNPEDRSAIQASIGEVLRRIASNEIDPRRAGLLLYGLQIASLNLPKSHPKEEPAEPVSEVTHDPRYGLLAPPAELHHDQPKSSIELLLEHFDDAPTINLQASAEAPATPVHHPKSTPKLLRLKTLRKKVRGGVPSTSTPFPPRTIGSAFAAAFLSSHAPFAGHSPELRVEQLGAVAEDLELPGGPAFAGSFSFTAHSRGNAVS